MAAQRLKALINGPAGKDNADVLLVASLDSLKNDVSVSRPIRWFGLKQQVACTNIDQQGGALSPNSLGIIMFAF